MRVMKSLRPLHELPPDVPVIYGGIMMYVIARMAVAPQFSISPLLSTYEMTSVGVAISIGALRHTHLILARIAKWSWSKVLGKTLYIISTTICVAVGAAEATRITRHIVHADAKYFPSFLGLLSSWLVILNFVRCIAIFLVVCGVVLFCINLPSLLLRITNGHTPFFWHNGMYKLFVWWRRVRFGRSPNPALLQDRYLRDIVELLTPMALVGLASLVMATPDSIMSARLTSVALNQAVFNMEYTSDGGCPNVEGDLPTVHLYGDFVSVATLENGRLVTKQQTCHISRE